MGNFAGTPDALWPIRRSCGFGLSLDLAASREPARAFGPELGERLGFVGFALLRGERVAPAPVRSLVDERLGAALPEYAADGRGKFGVGLHVIEGAVFDDRGELGFVDRNVEKPSDLSRMEPGRSAFI